MQARVVLRTLVAASLAAGVAASARADSPPVVTLELPRHPGWLHDGQVVRVTVRVDDADGDLVSARLLAAPDSQGFVALRDAPAGSARSWWWNTTGAALGPHAFVVEAWDSFDPARRVRASATVRLTGASDGAAVRFHREAGLRDELVTAIASAGDVQGIVDAGALVRFHSFGARGPGLPPTLLAAASPQPAARLGARAGNSFELGDVTGDGRLDVVARSGGELEVWSAPAPGVGLVGSSATLRSSDPAAGFLGTHGASFFLADVSGDGVLDVVAVAPFADVGGVTDAGEIAVFLGGAALVGTPAPSASLRIPGAVAGDALGHVVASPLGVHVGVESVVAADVTGDGIADLIALAALADAGGRVDAGRAFVWEGGAALSGTPAPRATLDPASLIAGDRLGALEECESLYVADWSGDGVLDVLVGCALAGSGGSLFFWRGGAALTGARDADARLHRGAGAADDAIGCTASGLGIHVADLDGDGTSDLLAAAPRADLGGATDAGVLLFFRGGAWNGDVAESATLQRATPLAGDRLAEAHGGVQFADVTGDGRIDVVVAAPLALGAAPASGLVAVFAGGPGAWSGTTVATAELQVPGAAANDRLCETATSPGGANGCGLLLVDATGDGIEDVVAVAAAADLGGLVDAGGAWVFSGGAALAAGGVVAPLAELRDRFPTASGFAGHHVAGGWGVRAGDVTGDGIADLALVAPSLAGMSSVVANVATRVLLFAGGAAMTGAPATFAWTDAAQQHDEGGLARDDLRLLDLDDDGAAEIVLFAPHFDAPDGSPRFSTGALLVHPGGRPGRLEALALHDAAASDGASVRARWLAERDYDGDGTLDLLLVQPLADAGRTDAAGKLLLWRGAGNRGSDRSTQRAVTPPGTPGPQPALAPECATAGARLGDAARLGE